MLNTFQNCLLVALSIISATQLAVEQPMPLHPLHMTNDPAVQQILDKITMVIRKHHNIRRPSTGMGTQISSSRPNRPNDPPVSYIRLTVPQAKMLLKNLQEEYNMTDKEVDNLTMPSRRRPRFRPRRGYPYIGLAPTDNHPVVNFDCLKTPSGRDYVGKKSSTISGFPCQRWDSQTPHGHSYTNGSAFPDGSVSAAANYCRNPNPNYTKGVWCYTNAESFILWELCDVPVCGAKKPKKSDMKHFRLSNFISKSAFKFPPL